MENTSRRFQTFEACYNFRDLGGYAGLHGRPVRWGRLFRSMTPEYMTDADSARARGLNIGLVLDLRGERACGSGAVGEKRLLAAWRWGRASCARREDLPPEVKALMVAPPEVALPQLLQTYGPSFAQAVVAMCDDPGAVTLFHCRLGQLPHRRVQRAAAQKLLRVADADVVIEDYMLTRYFEPEMKQLLSRHEDDMASREPRVAREPGEPARDRVCSGAPREPVRHGLQLLPASRRARGRPQRAG